MENFYYRRKLPHIQPPNGTYFITFILHNCIPRKVWQELANDYDKDKKMLEQTILLSDSTATQEQRLLQLKELTYQLQKKYFGRLDNFLDTAPCPNPWLKNDAVAQIVHDSILWANDRHYQLWTSCIMPTHVHLLLTLHDNAPMLFEVLQSIKSYSAKMANRLLQREGKFWLRESYDHLVRPNGEFQRIEKYILNNPVKANLVSRQEDYKWIYQAD